MTTCRQIRLPETVTPPALIVTRPMSGDAAGLMTIGHGTDGRAELAARLLGSGVGTVLDVRRYPGSRRNPDVHTDALGQWLPEHGIDYRSDERLGGRRRVREAEEVDTWWRVQAFRAYAAHTRSEEFRAAMSDLLATAETSATAIMCSESVWWRCHRRIVADVATLLCGVSVDHVMPDGRLVRHEPSPGARVSGDVVVWDGP